MRGASARAPAQQRGELANRPQESDRHVVRCEGNDVGVRMVEAVKAEGIRWAVVGLRVKGA